MRPPRSNGSIAKITRPRISGAFYRTRLFRLLDMHLEYPAVWISAAAGSGKTTLAASYLAEKRLPSIWYQMDPGDSDIATFFYYMGRAAAKAAPRKTTLPLLTPEYLQGIGTFTSRYFDKLFSRLKAPFLIVFDNYHLVAQDSPLHQVIDTCINTLPAGIRIVCISRHDPPAQFARLRANERLRVMAAGDIRFTLDESLKMMCKKGGKELPAPAIQRLHEKTGGWAAGLVLMLERSRIKGIDAVESPQLVAEDVFDYFACEVFEKTDPKTRKFLLGTSFLPKMTVTMARELTGMKRSGKILADLYRNHFFLQKDIQLHPYYQIHPLFRDFLQSKVSEEMTSKQVLATCRDSARILETAGQVEDAVALLIAAKDWESLSPLLISHAPAILRQGRRDTLDAWLTAFPGEILDQAPWHHYWLGVCRMDKAPGKSRVCFETAFNLFENREDLSGTLLSWSGVVGSLILTWDDYTLLDPWVEWLDNFVENARPFPSREVEARTAANMAAALVWRFPYRHDVEQWLDRVDRLSREVGNQELAFQNQFQRTNYFFFAGDLNRLKIMVQTMSAMAPDADAPPLSRICLTVSLAISQVMHAYADPRALELVTEGLEMSTHTGILLFNNIFYILGFFAAMNIGNASIADEYLGRMAQDLKEGTRDYVGRYYMCFAWRRLMDGDLAQARTAAEQGFRMAMEGGGLNSRQMMHHLLSLILQGQKRYDDALRQILSARKLIPAPDEDYYYDYLCYLTEADIHRDMGMDDRALECLKKAMSIGRTHGYKSLFLFWRPAAMARLFAMALMHGIEVDYAGELVVALGLSGDGVPAHVENWPWPLMINTLGKFELHRDGKPLSFTGKSPKKPLELLMAIVSMGGENVRNERIKDRLWPDAEGDKAQSAFTSALSRLRTLIGKEMAVQVHDGMVSLDPRHCQVDVWAFEQLADLAEKRQDKGHDAVGDENNPWAEKAIAMYGGPFLAEVEDQPWIIPMRERLSLRYRRLVMLAGGRP
jgi:ATP/maltotriose-dependent transcriptional regulator MalT